MSRIVKIRPDEVNEIKEITKLIIDISQNVENVSRRIARVRGSILAKIARTKGSFPLKEITPEIDELNRWHEETFGGDALSLKEIFEAICEAL